MWDAPVLTAATARSAGRTPYRLTEGLYANARFPSPGAFLGWLREEKIAYKASVAYEGKGVNGQMKKRRQSPGYYHNDDGVDTDYARFDAETFPYGSILFANSATREILGALALDLAHVPDEDGAERRSDGMEKNTDSRKNIVPSGVRVEEADLTTTTRTGFEYFCRDEHLRLQAFFSHVESASLTHRDTTASLLYVASGSKSVWMAPPEASQHHRQEHNFLLFDPHSAPMPIDHELSGVWKHFTVSPGEAIHLPRMWWHHINSTGGTLAFGIKCKPRVLPPYTFVLITLPTLYVVRSWQLRALLIMLALGLTAIVMVYL